jgi:hypothetical protein
MSGYYHITNTPLVLGDRFSHPGYRLVLSGKPIGLWYAAGTTWIRHETERYAYVYKFPLEGKFVEDIKTPDRTRIFHLTAENIEAFEETFRPYYLSHLYRALRDKEENLYEIALKTVAERRGYPLFSPEEEVLVNKFQTSKKINRKILVPTIIREFLIRELSKYPGMEIDVYKRPATLAEVSNPAPPKRVTLSTSMSSSRGFTEHLKMFDRIRLFEYGKFFEEVMEKQWGGIDFDVSLFTDTLKTQYPFLVEVEVPSGCLWHPAQVMAGYEPTPVEPPTGGKRTRRKRLRKSTRRRKQ